MESNITKITEILLEEDNVTKSQSMPPAKKFRHIEHIVWKNVAIMSYLHLSALYGIYLVFTSAKLITSFFAYVIGIFGTLGVTGGCHRLWAHRSYKAKWPLQVLLVIMNTIAFQDDVIHWARDHRLHHKYSDTDADPHNAKNGFFFSHIGWLLCKKHPEVKEKGKGIDISDLYSNPILMFQKKYYLVLVILLSLIIPIVIPVVCCNETWKNAYFITFVLRYVLTLNFTWLVNSAAHLYGNKPYDKHIYPSQNAGIAIFGLGEDGHNYHHTFPWDYRSSELGNYRSNLTAGFIGLFAKIGWAYDLKTTPEDMVRKRVEKTGDGSHELWGWGDKDQTKEERDQAIVTHNHTKDHQNLRYAHAKVESLG